MARGAFGEAVVAACKDKGISQVELAEELGVSSGFLSDCLRGQRLFPQSHWTKLTRVLPALTLERVTLLAIQTWPLKIDMTQAPLEEQALVAGMVAKIVQRATSKPTRRK